MKNLISQARLMSVAGALFWLPIGFAADSNSAAQQPASAAQTASAKLPSGAAEVVKLSRAQVSEEVIVSYVQNSGSTYGLGSDDIVRLRSEGVSDRVINTMLDHHKQVMETAQMTVSPPPVYAQNDANSTAPEATQPAQTYVQPAQTPAQAAPASSVYVIPYPQATPAYYGYSYRPYYSPYYYAPPYYGYYGGPVVSFGFGFGGGYRGGGYYHGGHGHFHHRWH
jgi:hypothetical protein